MYFSELWDVILKQKLSVVNAKTKMYVSHWMFFDQVLDMHDRGHFSVGQNFLVISNLIDGTDIYRGISPPVYDHSHSGDKYSETTNVIRQTQLAFKNTVLVVGEEPGVVGLWDIQRGKLLKKLHHHCKG